MGLCSSSPTEEKDPVAKKPQGLIQPIEHTDVAKKTTILEETQYTIGMRVFIPKMKCGGVVRYIGLISQKAGTWIGIELDLPIGKHEGLGYFTTAQNCACLVTPDKIFLANQSISNVNTVHSPPIFNVKQKNNPEVSPLKITLSDPSNTVKPLPLNSQPKNEHEKSNGGEKVNEKEKLENEIVEDLPPFPEHESDADSDNDENIPESPHKSQKPINITNISISLSDSIEMKSEVKNKNSPIIDAIKSNEMPILQRKPSTPRVEEIERIEVLEKKRQEDLDEEFNLLAEQEARLKAEEEEALRKESESQNIEKEMKQIAEAAKKKAEEEEAKYRQEQDFELIARAEAAAFRMAEEARLEAEREAKRKSEEDESRAKREAKLKEEAKKREEIERLQAEETEVQRKMEESRRLAEAEAEAIRLAEEARLKAEEEAHLKAEEEAHLKAEEEARRLAEEEGAKAKLLAKEDDLFNEEEIRERKNLQDQLTSSKSLLDNSRQQSDELRKLLDLANSTFPESDENLDKHLDFASPSPFTKENSFGLQPASEYANDIIEDSSQNTSDYQNILMKKWPAIWGHLGLEKQKSSLKLLYNINSILSLPVFRMKGEVFEDIQLHSSQRLNSFSNIDIYIDNIKLDSNGEYVMDWFFSANFSGPDNFYFFTPHNQIIKLKQTSRFTLVNGKIQTEILNWDPQQWNEELLPRKNTESSNFTFNPLTSTSISNNHSHNDNDDQEAKAAEKQLIFEEELARAKIAVEHAEEVTLKEAALKAEKKAKAKREAELFVRKMQIEETLLVRDIENETDEKNIVPDQFVKILNDNWTLAWGMGSVEQETIAINNLYTPDALIELEPYKIIGKAQEEIPIHVHLRKNAIQDYKVEIFNIYSVSDSGVAIDWTLSGTFSGPGKFYIYSPLNKTIVLKQTSIFRLHPTNKILHENVQWKNKDWKKQLKH